MSMFDEEREKILSSDHPEASHYLPIRIGQKQFFFNQFDERFYPVALPAFGQWFRRVSNGILSSDFDALDLILQRLAEDSIALAVAS